MTDKTKVIEITFPVEVEFPLGFERTLDALLGMICEQYQKENPDRVMWPAGMGGKPMGNIMISDNVDYDMSYLCIDIAEREDLHGNNPYNPNREALREKARANRQARKSYKR